MATLRPVTDSVLQAIAGVKTICISEYHDGTQPIHLATALPDPHIDVNASAFERTRGQVEVDLSHKPDHPIGIESDPTAVNTYIGYVAAGFGMLAVYLFLKRAT
jgi:hypothetical protein